MHIVFLLFGTREIASTRYRVLQFVPHLERDGFRVTLAQYTAHHARFVAVRKFWYMVRAFFTVIGADVVVIQKILLPPLFVSFVRLLGKPIVFDVDDAIWLRVGKRASDAVPDAKLARKLGHVLSRSKKVIVGNDFLRIYASRYALDIDVIPSVVDMRLYPEKIYHQSDSFCLGWIGAPVNFSSLEMLEPVFAALAQKYGRRVYLKVISSVPYESKSGIQVMYAKWSEESAVSEMLEFDVGLMPLEDSEWTRGKCAFKAIEYMAAGIAPVVSPVGANVTTVIDGETGFHARTTDEWVAVIEKVMSDIDVRRMIGARARKHVGAQYSVTGAYPQFKKVIQSAVRHE
jgi:glycosyltransferase involved in cell wall biosynthesis